MVRQPYSVAVPSTGGRLHPLSPEGKGAWGKAVEPSLRVKRDGVIFEKPHSSDDQCRAILQWGTKYNFFQKIGG